MNRSQKYAPSETDLELYARVQSQPAGTFKLYSGNNIGTEERIRQHLRNLDDLQNCIRRAVSAGCHIEAIALRLQVIDFWLRIFLVNRSPGAEARKHQFGQLLGRCGAVGLDVALIDRLKRANSSRIYAEHGFVVGKIGYSDLAQVAAEFDQLVKVVVEFVVRNCGTVVTSRDQLAASPGAVVVEVENFCREVNSGVRY